MTIEESFYTKKVKSKRKSNSEEAGAVAELFGKVGVDVVTIKYRNWWYQWYSTWILWFAVLPIFMIPFWVRNHLRAKKQIFELLKDGYQVSDDYISKTIVVQFCGFPLDLEKDFIYTKKSELSEIKKDFKRYKKEEMKPAEVKAFEKRVIRYWNSYKTMLEGTRLKRN